jgi:Na+/H+-translocating membrane pyrophosphatase
MQEIAGAIKKGPSPTSTGSSKAWALQAVIIFIIIAITLGVKTAIGFSLGASPPTWPATSACGYRSWPTCARPRRRGAG